MTADATAITASFIASAPSGLSVDDLSLGYAGRTVVTSVSAMLPPGRVTAIVGPNGCGKSTLLRGLARLLVPTSGHIRLDGAELATLPPRVMATRLGLLPQQAVAPDGITVADLVGRGRHPHQKWFRQWSTADADAVDHALRDASVAELADTPIDELSGGQRQRVWIALALAQGPDIMLLDEPTTFLDLAHQIDVLDLLASLNQRHGRTIVMVLHDLNMAARYADHLIAMRGGSVVAQGQPSDVVTDDMVQAVFGIGATVIADPVTGTPLVVPHSPRGTVRPG